MSETNIVNTIKNVIENMPEDWLRLTTHRLDIYNESLAKVEFLQQFEKVGAHSREELAKLPTAFDYIRLGHCTPLRRQSWASSPRIPCSPRAVRRAGTAKAHCPGCRPGLGTNCPCRVFLLWSFWPGK